MAEDDLTRIQPIKGSALALRSLASGQLYPLSGETLVGREIECDIQLISPQVSRYHAKIYVSATGLYIEDLNSSNGTYVNGRRVQGRAHISLGDQICFDDLEFRVTTAKSGAESKTDLHPPDNIVKFNRPNSDSLPEDLPIAGQNQPDNDTPAAAGAKRAAQAPSQEVQAFLEFAASGLEPQSPVPREEANPFRLLRQRDGMAGKSSTSAEPKSRDVTPTPAIKESRLRAESSRARAEEAKLSPPIGAPLQRGQPEQGDDDRTNYISLNQLDRYVETHEKYQQDLQLGSGPRLIAMTAPIRGKVFALQSDDEVKCWSIGRDDDADICLRDKAVSREHAWITKLNSLYQLRVNDSANGILVNGQSRVEVDLRHGDRMQFGAIELVFRLDENPAMKGGRQEGKARKRWQPMEKFFKRLFGNS